MKILEMLEKAATQNVSKQQKERFLSNFFFVRTNDGSRQPVKF